MRRIMGLVAALFVTAGMILAGSSSAQAAGKDGVINEGEFIQWYFAGYSGGCVDDWFNDPSYAGETLKNCGWGTAGVGASVPNNTRSYWNTDYSWTAWACANANYVDPCFAVAPRSSGNYSGVYFDGVESMIWG